MATSSLPARWTALTALTLISIGTGVPAQAVPPGNLMVIRGGAIIEEPSVKQIALLRWYVARHADTDFSVGEGPRSFAFDGENMWIIDAGATTAAVYRASDLVSQMTPTVGSDAVEIAFDGGNMSTANRTPNTVTIVSARDGSLVDPLGTGDGVGAKPTNVAFDGVNM